MIQRNLWRHIQNEQQETKCSSQKTSLVEDDIQLHDTILGGGGGVSKQTCTERNTKRNTQYGFNTPDFSNYAVAGDWLHIPKTSEMRQTMVVDRKCSYTIK